MVSHRSALWLWRHGWHPVRRIGPEEAKVLLGTPPSRDEVDRALCATGHPDDRPLDVLVGADGLRRRLSAVTSHMLPVATAPWPGLLVEVRSPDGGSPLVAVAPETSWAQTAGYLGVRAAREAAWELTGTFRVDPDAPFGLAERRPLTSVQQCREAAALLTGGTVPKPIERTLQGVLDEAASPAEGRVACLMTLSRRRGGYDLPKPLLNPNVILNDDERFLVGTASVRPDFLWPEAGVVLEYDSDSAHFDNDAAARARHDAHKRNLYESRGWRHLSLTRDQLMDPGACDRVMGWLASALDKRVEPPSESILAARRTLRRELFGR